MLGAGRWADWSTAACKRHGLMTNDGLQGGKKDAIDADKEAGSSFTCWGENGTEANVWLKIPSRASLGLALLIQPGRNLIEGSYLPRLSCSYELVLVRVVRIPVRTVDQQWQVHACALSSPTPPNMLCT